MDFYKAIPKLCASAEKPQIRWCISQMGTFVLGEGHLTIQFGSRVVHLNTFWEFEKPIFKSPNTWAGMADGHVKF